MPTPRLRIALVGPLPPPSGGMANQTRQLARLLRDDGIDVQLIQTNPAYRPAWIGKLRGLRALPRLVSYLAALWRGLRGADVAHVMANSGWAWHLFAAPAIWIARVRGVPVLVNYRGGEAEPFLARQRRWVVPTLRRTSGLVVPSGFLQQVFRAHGVASAIVPNVVDLARYAPAVASRPFEWQCLAARNLEDIYDMPTTIRAFARIRERHAQARLTIAGSGPALLALQALVATLGLQSCVTFAGRIDNDAMPLLYRAADVLLNSSTVDNMPISLLEAMASGVPIASTDVGGIPFMVGHERTALLVPARDPAALAQAVLRIGDDAALRERLRANGLRDVASYTWASVGPLWRQAYQRCAGRALPAECAT